MCPRYFSLYGLLVALPVSALCQERTAGSSLEIQTTWTALKSIADTAVFQSRAAQLTADNARNRVLKLEACNKQGLFYAPETEGADKATGCKTPSPSTNTLPDTLVCVADPNYGGSPRVRLLFELYASGAYGSNPDRAYYGYAGWYTHIVFDRASGKFLYRRGESGGWITDCENKTLGQLIAMKRAYWRQSPLIGADSEVFKFPK